MARPLLVPVGGGGRKIGPLIANTVSRVEGGQEYVRKEKEHFCCPVDVARMEDEEFASMKRSKGRYGRRESACSQTS